MTSPAWMSKQIDSGKIECTACYQFCKLSENEYGKCGVRFVHNNQLQSSVYGLTSAINIDPIEKKPLYHFLPSTNILSFGTMGCNFSCTFCQNADISQYPKEHNYDVKGRVLMPHDVINLAKQHNTPSIAYTYNEPAVFFEYAYDTAKLATENGIKNVFVTSGYESTEALQKISPFLDGTNIDIKSFSDDFYKNICGARLKPVLKCVEEAKKLGIWIEITTLLIEGLNDSDEEIVNIAKFIASIDKNAPLHLSGFYPRYKMLDRPATSAQTLKRAYEIALAQGLKYVYLGNFDDPDNLHTYCPKCSQIVIERSGRLGERSKNLLDDGYCTVCGYETKGVWN